MIELGSKVKDSITGFSDVLHALSHINNANHPPNTACSGFAASGLAGRK
jgi:hypothetical protein